MEEKERWRQRQRLRQRWEEGRGGGRKKRGNIVMMIFAFSRYREIKKIANALPMIYINQKLKAICS